MTDSKCGGCFSEMVDMKVSATHVGDAVDGEIVGEQCLNCGRTYLENLVEGVSLRLDRAEDSRMDQ